MEIDPLVMQSLPFHHRQKLCRQLRQEQIRQYHSWIQNEAPVRKKKVDSPKIKKRKSGKRAVIFAESARLGDAVSRFDDREVLALLESGEDANLVSGTGVPLLSKCALEDNFTAAELLLSHGADVNQQDRDLWTPLHYAASTDHADLVQLLLGYDADVLLLDVDGNFAVDHAPEGSESRAIIDRHYSDKGFDENYLNELRLQKPRSMYNEVYSVISAGQDLNQCSDEGISLLHISSANGFSRVSQILLREKVDVIIQDDAGNTPLHVAAKYGQTKAVKILLNHGADPYTLNENDQKASDLAMNEDLRKLLLDAEAKKPKPQLQSQLSEDGEDVYVDGYIRRINSKIIRPRHTPLSKKDELYEAKTRASRMNEGQGQSEGSRLTPQASIDEAEEEEEEYNDDDIYENLKFGNVQEKQSSQEAGLQERVPNDDFAKLPEVTEKILLSELEKRYMADRIYTYLGDILIAVNPFKPLNIYSKSVSLQYHNTEEHSNLPPHIFAVAEQAYRAMLRERRSQCCVISGESGAGKTESCKYMVQHLLMIAHSEEGKLNRRIQQVNPLLEAFGNAQTVMNNNSSRFGKFLEIMFSESGIVQGARINEYLLESSRVVYQAKEETNFHIFYLLFAGLTPEEINQYGLREPHQHRYLQAGALGNDPKGSQTRVKFRELKDCLGFVGFTKDDINNLMVSLVSILHLGDVQFKPVGNNDAAQIVDTRVLAKVSSLLSVSDEELGSALVGDIHITRGERIRKERTVQQACDCRDALAKSLYRRLFSWIVNGINQMIQPLEGNDSLDIGILDIFGFENFPRNSFEQLCINLANEQLQYYFNEHIFQLELQECAEEDIEVNDFSFTNNKAILDLFLAKPLGILSLLDEESRFPKATDKSLATKLHTGSGKTYSHLYLAPKDGGTSFAIVHYAGKVTYDLNGVLDKVRDTLPASILITMKTSNNLLIKDMFQSRVTRTGSLAPSVRQQKTRKTNSKSPFDFFKKKPKVEIKSRKTATRVPDASSLQKKGPTTVAFHFKNSLMDLVAKMNAACPHFVRCIKPNLGKTSSQFHSDYVLAQLRYTGIMETIRIRKEGFPIRIKFTDFLDRYATLNMASKSSQTGNTDLDHCTDILHFTNVDNYKVGRTRLFLRYWHLENLEKRANELSVHIINIQRATRGWLARRQYRQTRALRQQQASFLARFFQDIQMKTDTMYGVIISTNENDTKRHDVAAQKQKLLEDDQMEREIFQSLEALDRVVEDAENEEDPTFLGNEEIRKSIEALDCIIDEYDDDYGFLPPPVPPHPPPEEEYHTHSRSPPPPDIAAGVIASYFPGGHPAPQLPQRQHSAPSDYPSCPHHHQGLVSSPPASILRNHEYSTGPKRQPPQVPRRNPETRLSVSSESSATQDDVAPPPREYDDTPESGYQTSEVDTLGSEADYPLHHGGTVPYRGTRESFGHSDHSQYGDPPMGHPRAPPMPPSSLTPDLGFRGSTNSIPGFPPPPPPGNSQEETFQTRLPSRYDDMAGDDLYGASLPHSNGYPEEGQELYGTTLPKPIPELRRAPVTLPKKAPVPKPQETRSDAIPPPPAPPHFSPTSPERDFPPPPPPLQFADGSGSPNKYAPKTMPKPRRGSGPTSPVSVGASLTQPRKASLDSCGAPPPPPLSTMPMASPGEPMARTVPPPPPPLSTMPRSHPTGILIEDTPPPPPPTSTIPRSLNRGAHDAGGLHHTMPAGSSANGGLAAQLAAIQLRSAEEEDERPSKPGSQPHAHLELINQIQGGVNLKSSPLGNKIRGDDDPEPVFYEDVDSATSSAPPPPLPTFDAADTNGEDTLSRPQPPPTLPKTKSVSSTMPSGGVQQNNTCGSNLDLDEPVDEPAAMQDPRTLPGYQEIPENCPTWKRAMIDKKNKLLEDEARKNLVAQREEEERWKGVPEWKKKIIQEKQKKKSEDEALLKDQQFMTEEQASKLASMPDWKRDLLRKKRGDV